MPDKPFQMLRHNLLIILRGLRKFKSTFIINLLGLSSGLTCALLIYLWVQDEMSIDKFHTKDARLYQVMTNLQTQSGWSTLVDTPGPLARTLSEEMPEIEYSTSVAPSTWRGFNRFLMTVNNQTVNATGQYTGQDYFNIFSYPLVTGNASQVLADKHSIVISDELAMKLFSQSHDVIGKTVLVNHEKQYTISGTFRKVSASSVQFDFILPFESYLEVAGQYKSWNDFGPHTYIVLREGTNLRAFNAKLKTFYQRKTEASNTAPQFFATLYSDSYLHGKFDNGLPAEGGRITYVKLFSAIGFFILIIACINFMNLATAKSAVRLKEIGVKKTLGADRKKLAIQFIGESTLMAILSLIVALVLVQLLLPEFNTITGKFLLLNFNAQFVTLTAGITLITGLLAGCYPAIYLSGFSAVSVLKGKSGNGAGELWIRKGLVAFQFTLSVVLIVCVVVVYKQIEYVQTSNLGYDKDNVILFEVEGRVKQTPQTFLSELKQIPGIEDATSTTSDMTGHSWSVGFDWEGKTTEDQAKAELMAVNQDFLKTLNLQLTDGRFFSREFKSDTASVVINETAAKLMGFKNPIGKHVKGKFEIIGVIKDFHLESFHEEVKPQLFVLHEAIFAPPSLIMARIEAGKEKETLQRLASFYKDFNPGFPLAYTFLEDDYMSLYVSEQRVSILSKYFAGLAILISCLGLFGLAAFTAQRRIKEIGIRKVLGSTDFGIVRLLSGDFTKTVFIAIIIALPVSYFITSKWLSGFAYRISLELWFFIGSGCMALFIAWFTVALQTVRASRVNPTECLKNE
jgi:putative ABC transport system permease protein